MPSVRAKTVQISDLHMNRKVKSEVAGMLKQIICKLGPDILIASGDLANQPVPWQMKRAAKFIREIEQECKKTHPILRTIVIPGNHDFKYWGNFGLGRLSRRSFEVYFRQCGLEHGFFWRCWKSFRLVLNALWWKGRAMREPVVFESFPEHPDLGLAIFTVNSNSLDEMMAGGEVGSTDLQSLYTQVALGGRLGIPVHLQDFSGASPSSSHCGRPHRCDGSRSGQFHDLLQRWLISAGTEPARI